MDAPNERRVGVEAHDLERSAVGDRRDGALGQQQRRVELAVAESLCHGSGAAGVIAPCELDVERLEPARLERKMPWQVEVLRHSTNSYLNHWVI